MNKRGKSTPQRYSQHSSWGESEPKEKKGDGGEKKDEKENVGVKEKKRLKQNKPFRGLNSTYSTANFDWWKLGFGGFWAYLKLHDIFSLSKRLVDIIWLWFYAQAKLWIFLYTNRFENRSGPHCKARSNRLHIHCMAKSFSKYLTQIARQQERIILIQRDSDLLTRPMFVYNGETKVRVIDVDIERSVQICVNFVCVICAQWEFNSHFFSPSSSEGKK